MIIHLKLSRRERERANCLRQIEWARYEGAADEASYQPGISEREARERALVRVGYVGPVDALGHPTQLQDWLAIQLG